TISVGKVEIASVVVVCSDASSRVTSSASRERKASASSVRACFLCLCFSSSESNSLSTSGCSSSKPFFSTTASSIAVMGAEESCIS
ncbi:hypothetical protein PMAYCL1PPCAC_06333, partial [Pristionchus mayeri]